MGPTDQCGWQVVILFFDQVPTDAFESVIWYIMTMNQDVQYIFPRKCYLQYSGHGVQLDCGRNDEVAKKSV